MANVYFKRGHQSSLDTLINNVKNNVSGAAFVEGTFYLTDDTNRLYFAQSDASLVDLNQYIHFVQNYNSLPTSSSTTLKDGDIYYLQNENILCVYQAGASQPWVQVNPDTRLAPNQTQVVTIDAPENTNSADVAFTIRDSGLPARTAQGNFTIVGGSNVHVTTNGTTITITSDNDDTNTTYTIGTSNNTTKGVVNLNPSSGTGSSIDIVGDNSNIFVSSDAAGQVTIRGSSGVTGISDGFDSNGSYGITLQRTAGGNLNTAGVIPTIEYGQSGNKSTAVFASVDGGTPTAVLDVYTTTQVNNLFTSHFASLDALKYAGTVSQGSGTPNDAATKLVNQPVYGVGTVYKAATNIELSSPSVSAKIGDLIIASGNNDAAVTWEVVPSGDDQFINVVGSAAENLVTFTDTANGKTNTSIGSFDIQGTAAGASGAGIAVNATVTNNSKDISFAISHGSAGTGTAVTVPAASGSYIQSTGTALSIPVITGITKDAHGHITDVTAQTYQLTDTHAVLQPIITTTDAVDNAASVTFGIKLDTNGTLRQCGFGITSDNLVITASDATDNININLEWGTF